MAEQVTNNTCSIIIIHHTTHVGEPKVKPRVTGVGAIMEALLVEFNKMEPTLESLHKIKRNNIVNYMIFTNYKLIIVHKSFKQIQFLPKGTTQLFGSCNLTPASLVSSMS